MSSNVELISTKSNDHVDPSRDVDIDNTQDGAHGTDVATRVDDSSALANGDVAVTAPAASADHEAEGARVEHTLPTFAIPNLDNVNSPLGNTKSPQQQHSPLPHLPTSQTFGQPQDLPFQVPNLSPQLPLQVQQQPASQTQQQQVFQSSYQPSFQVPQTVSPQGSLPQNPQQPSFSLAQQGSTLTTNQRYQQPGFDLARQGFVDTQRPSTVGQAHQSGQLQSGGSAPRQSIDSAILSTNNQPSSSPDSLASSFMSQVGNGSDKDPYTVAKLIEHSVLIRFQAPKAALHNTTNSTPRMVKLPGDSLVDSQGNPIPFYKLIADMDFSKSEIKAPGGVRKTVYYDAVGVCNSLTIGQASSIINSTTQIMAHHRAPGPYKTFIYLDGEVVKINMRFFETFVKTVNNVDKKNYGFTVSKFIRMEKDSMVTQSILPDSDEFKSYSGKLYITFQPITMVTSSKGTRFVAKVVEVILLSGSESTVGGVKLTQENRVVQKPKATVPNGVDEEAYARMLATIDSYLERGCTPAIITALIDSGIKAKISPQQSQQGQESQPQSGYQVPQQYQGEYNNYQQQGVYQAQTPQQQNMYQPNVVPQQHVGYQPQTNYRTGQLSPQHSTVGSVTQTPAYVVPTIAPVGQLPTDSQQRPQQYQVPQGPTQYPTINLGGARLH